MAPSRDPEPKKGSDSNKKQMATPRTTSTGTPRRESTTRQERQDRRTTGTTPPAAPTETPRVAVTTSEVARNRTADRKRERDRREMRQRNLAIIIGVVVVVVFVAFMFYVSARPADAPVPTDTATRYTGLTTTRTDQGFIRLTRADNLRPSVQVSLYCDFDSVGCQTFHDQVLDQVLAKVRTEDVSFTFVPLYGRIGNSEGASRAAVCAADQGAFWKMADALYSWLGLYGQVQAFTNNRLLTGVTNLGLDRPAFDGCIAGNRPADIINAAVAESVGLTNFKGAPAVAVSGVLVVDDKSATVTDGPSVLAAIDRTLAQVKAAQATPDVTAVATSEATAESTESASATATAEATTLPAIVATSEVTPVATVEAVPAAATEALTAESTAVSGGG